MLRQVVLAYLARYTHRTAIGNERIKSITGEEVVFTVRADDKGGKRSMRLDGAEFIRRFVLHILPTGIKRIRHYGVLASGCKAQRLQAARSALRMPPASARAAESAKDFMKRTARQVILQCPCCTAGVLRVVAVQCGVKRLPAPGEPVPALAALRARGPP